MLRRPAAPGLVALPRKMTPIASMFTAGSEVLAFASAAPPSPTRYSDQTVCCAAAPATAPPSAVQPAPGVQSALGLVPAYEKAPNSMSLMVESRPVLPASGVLVATIPE